MKKLFKVAVVALVGLNIVGCEDGNVTTLNEVESSIEEIVEVEEIQGVNEEEIIDDSVEENEVVEEQIDEFDYEELQYHLTNNLSDSEYESYFDLIAWIDGTSTLREIEFDAHIMFVTPSEKYKTRCELLMASGDFNNGEFTGPYIKTRDIAYTQLNGTGEGSNVRVKATIDGYDTDYGYLKITIREITSR